MTAPSFQKYCRSFQLQHSACLVNRIASFAGSLVCLESFAAVLEHLGHEGESFKLAMTIERFQDLTLASYLYAIADS